MISWWSFVPFFFFFDRSLNSTNEQPLKSSTAPPCTRRWSWAGPGSAATQLPANMLRETPAQCGSSHYFKVPWLAFTHASAQTPKQLVFSSASTCCSSVIFRLQSLCLPFSTLCITTLTVFPTLCLLRSYPVITLSATGLQQGSCCWTWGHCLSPASREHSLQQGADPQQKACLEVTVFLCQPLIFEGHCHLEEKNPK